jgi:hypothetical protein
MTAYTGMCTCAAGCARNPLGDPGVFGDDCSCWCHTRRDRLPAPAHAERDPLLAALAEARQRRDQAAAGMRLLLAYAREFAAPRSYRLAGLAQAAGMSISGIRTAYARVVRTRPLASVAVSGDRYSVGYSPPWRPKFSARSGMDVARR